MSTTARSRRRRALGGVGLLLAVTGAAGCGNPAQFSAACRELRRRPPATVAVQWVAPSGAVRRTPYYRHGTISIGVHEPDGLTLGFENPAYLWCALVPETRVDAWIAHAERLRPRLRELTRMPEPHGELLIIDFPADAPEVRPGLRISQAAFVAAGDLDPDGLAAALALSCLAGAAFGARAREAILDLTPTLAARSGFPGACTAATYGR